MSSGADLTSRSQLDRGRALAGLAATPHGSVVTPVVSVVIPTRNRLALLKEAVASVGRQDLHDWQLIVVDDDSSDGTTEWLTALEDPRIETVRCPRRMERSVARNLGLQRAVAPSVLFLDDDDRLDPGALRRLSSALQRRPEVFAAVGAKVVFDARGHRRRTPHPRLRMTRTAWRDVMAGWVAVTGQMLFRRDLLVELGGFDPTLAEGEDQELWLRAGRMRPATFIPSVVLEQRTHGTSRDGPDIDVVEAEMRERFIGELRGREGIEANQLTQARRELQSSVAAFERQDFDLAARCLYRACRLAPAMLLSPLIGPTIALSIGKATTGSLLPKSAALALRQWTRQLRLSRRQDPMADDTGPPVSQGPR